MEDFEAHAQQLVEQAVQQQSQLAYQEAPQVDDQEVSQISPQAAEQEGSQVEVSSEQSEAQQQEGQQDGQDEQEAVDPAELLNRKVNGLQWLQSLVKQDNIKLASGETSEEYAKVDMYQALHSGVVLCKALNNLMVSNPSFVEANLPPIEVNEKHDLFAYLSNLTSFVRTCELYFNVDRFHLLDPISTLQNTKDEKTFIDTVHFIRMVVEETSLNFPVYVAKPFVSITYDQLSTLISMITGRVDNPVVAYDPRVVMSVSDTEHFKKLQQKIDSLETNNKMLTVMFTQMGSKFMKMEEDSTFVRSRIEGITGGVLTAFESVNQKLNELREVSEAIASNAQRQRSGNYSQESPVQEHRIDVPQTIHEGSASPSPSVKTMVVSNSTEMPDRVATPAVGQYLTASPSQPNLPRLSTSSPANTGAKVFKLPDEVLAQNLPKEELMRQSVLYEVIDSEADYVRDINVMLEYHYKEMQQRNLLDAAQLKVMFSNLTDLLPVNQTLLANVVMRRDQNPVIAGIGDILLSITAKLMVYDEYCANYPNALSLYKSIKNREDMKAYLDKSMNSIECRGLSLESFLIKPVQRICKYPLLLRELIKYTPNENPDKVLLQQAMTQIEAVVSLVNERTRAQGDKDKLTELQSRLDATPPLNLMSVAGRRILREGPIQRVMQQKPKDRQIVILNDSVLICKVHMVGKNTRLMFEQSFELNKAVVNANPSSKLAGSGSAAQKMLRTMFEIVAGSESFAFAATNEQDKARWITSFDEAVRESQKMSHISTTQSAPVTRQASAVSVKSNSNSKGAMGTIRRKTGFFGKKGSQDSIADSAIPEDNTENFGFAPSTVALSTRKSNSSLAHEVKDEPTPPMPAIQQAPQQAQATAQPQVEQVPLPVEGYPIWRAVDSGMGAFYYFNTETNETSWYHPSQLQQAALAAEGKEVPQQQQ